MKAAALTLALSAMLTIEQRDPNPLAIGAPSASISADGRFVAFATYAPLVSDDTDSTSDVYVLDRLNRQVTLESSGIALESVHSVISADGRFVVHEMGESLVWRDRQKGASRIIAAGRQPFITPDARRVLFTSGRDIYSLDVQSGGSQRVSLDLPGLDASATSSNASASDDGRFISFSARPKFTRGRLPVSHVFVRDSVLNRTRHVAKGWAPAISGDGRYLAFVDNIRSVAHVYLADLFEGTSTVITRSVRGGLANGASASPSISSDGRFVVFQSEASDLVDAEDFNLLWDIFLYDRTAGTIVRVSGDPDGAWMEPSTGPSIDRTGSVVTFSSRHPTGPTDKENDFDLFVATINK